MKVLFVNPPWEHGIRGIRWAHTAKSGNYTPPVYLLYAAAIVQNSGHEVGFIDAVANALPEDEFIDKVMKHHPKMVVVSTSTPSIELDIRSIKSIKSATGAITVAVGEIVTVLDLDIMSKCTNLDYIARGEFDYTILDIVNNYRDGNGGEKILGITYRQGEKTIRNQDRPLIQDLDALPYPAYNLTDINLYHETIFKKLPAVTTVTSRGCPFNCSYCLFPQRIFGRRFRARSAGNVVDEMEYIKYQMKAKLVFFHDDTFSVDKKRVYDICKEIKNRKLQIKWDTLTRVDMVDRDLLEKMQDAGCVMIRYGVESSSEEILKNIRKGFSPKKVKEIFNITKDIGIETHATVMFGLPGETKETIRDTIDFVIELDPSFAQFSIATPYPGTDFFNWLEQKGYLTTKNWSKYNGSCSAVIRTEELNPEDLEDALKLAYNKFYGRWSYRFKRLARGLRSLGELEHFYRCVRAYWGRG